MAKNCTNCHKELEDEAKTCPYCGTEQAEQPDQPETLPAAETQTDLQAKEAPEAEQTAGEENPDAPPYPISTRTNNFAVVEILVVVFIVGRLLYNAFTQQEEMSTGALIATIVVALLGIAVLFFCWKTHMATKKVYIVPCPYCGKETPFPVGEEKYACKHCMNKMKMENNRVQIIPVVEDDEDLDDEDLEDEDLEDEDWDDEDEDLTEEEATKPAGEKDEEAAGSTETDGKEA